MKSESSVFYVTKRLSFNLGLVVMLMLLTYAPLKAQVPKRTFLNIISKAEVLGGPSWSSILGNVETDNSQFTKRRLKSGYSIGLGYTHLIRQRFDLEFLLLLEKKGTIADLSVPAGNATFVFDYTYVSVPVYANLRIGKKRVFSLGAGAYVSLLSKQTRTDIFPASQNFGTRDETYMNTAMDFGLNAQIKYIFPMVMRHNVSLRIQYTYGLIDTRTGLYPGMHWYSINTLAILGISLAKTD